MPRKGASIAGVAALPAETFLRESAIPLSLDERVALRAIFATPVFQRAWKNALTVAPGPMVPTGTLDSTMGAVKAVNRLHEMRGWEMFRAALASQVVDKPLPAVRVPENYPEDLQIVKAPKKP